VGFDAITPFFLAIVSVVAGFSLIGLGALIIFRNPGSSYQSAAVVLVGMGVLLILALGLGNFDFKAGFLEFRGAKEQTNVQGPDTNRTTPDQRHDAQEKSTNVTPPTTENYKKNKIILIFYNDKKELAINVQEYLFQKGYSAKLVYNDYSSGLEHANKKPGTMNVVYHGQNQELAKEIKTDLQSKYPEIVQVDMFLKPERTMSGDVQVQLF